MRRIKKTFASKDRPREIILTECQKVDDTCENYVWWKAFLSGLNLYPYVFTERFVPEWCDDYDVYPSHYVLALEC